MDEDEIVSAAIAWAPIRMDYEAGLLTRNAVARKYAIALPLLERQARASKWARPHSDITDRRILIFKLLGLLERQMDQVDEQMKSGSAGEVKVLTNMVRDLDKLIEIEKAEAGQLVQDTETKEMRDIQRKLEKRINAITKG
jgi:hypothetical protein